MIGEPNTTDTLQKRNNTANNHSTDKELDKRAILRLLEENKVYIDAIVHYQRRGQVAEAAEYQKRLHKNLAILLSAQDVIERLGGGGEGNHTNTNNATKPIREGNTL